MIGSVCGVLGFGLEAVLVSVRYFFGVCYCGFDLLSARIEAISLSSSSSCGCGDAEDGRPRWFILRRSRALGVMQNHVLLPSANEVDETVEMDATLVYARARDLKLSVSAVSL